MSAVLNTHNFPAHLWQWCLDWMQGSVMECPVLSYAGRWLILGARFRSASRATAPQGLGGAARRAWSPDRGALRGWTAFSDGNTFMVKANLSPDIIVFAGRRGQCRLRMLRKPLCKALLMSHEMSFWTWKSLLFLCPSLIQACLLFSETLFSRLLQPLKSIGVKHMLQCFQSRSLSFIFLQFLCSSHATLCMDQSSTNKSACCSLLVCALCQLKPHERSQGNMVWRIWPVKHT